jgi:uncharacterized protein (DUF4415 family)
MLKKHKTMKEFEPGHGFTKEDWDAVSDSPEWTEEDLKNARPFAEVFPELAESIRKSIAGRPKLERPKQPVSIRLDQDVIEHFKAGGEGWQSRMNDALRKAAGL